VLCDGRTNLLRASYPAAFWQAMIALGFAGDDGTKFGVPDYRGRTLVGKGTHADVNAFTDNDGLVVGSRTPKHKTSINDPNHHHTDDGAVLTGNDINPAGAHYGYVPFDSTGLAAPRGVHYAANRPTSDVVTGISGGTQDARPIDTPAYGVVNWFIYDGSTQSTTGSGGSGGTGAAGAPRVDSHITTANIAALAEEAGGVSLPRTTRFMKIVADRACRVRIYSTAADRDADAARAIGVDPADNTGLIAEWVFGGAGTIRCSPQPVGSNFDAAVVDTLYYRVQNRSGGAAAVDVTLTTQKVE
jgi:microcystin-dependent protein